MTNYIFEAFIIILSQNKLGEKKVYLFLLKDTSQ